MIKIGSLNISSFKLGGADCSIYLRSVKLYPTEEPTPPQYEGFCKLTINNGDVIELEGSGELKYTMISTYKSTLTSVEIGTLCTSIGYGAFNACIALRSIDIPSNVTTIDNYAFSSCIGLTSITIPSSITSISAHVFENCSRLTSVTMPNSVTSIGGYAFNYCIGLTSITIPSNVTNISSYNTFANCTSLTSVTVNATTPPTLRSDTNAFDNTNNCPIYVPSESVNAYKTAWSTYASRIQAIPT